MLLLSCFCCGGQLKYPTKLVDNPLYPGKKVTVCNGQCGAQLYKFKLRVDKNMEDVEKAKAGKILKRRRP